MNSEMLLAYFNRISDAPDAIPRLRRFMLDLAVRGRLAEPNSADEPASKLLARTQADKAQLIKRGEIPRQKTVPPVESDERPFEIPPSWCWVRLGDITTYIQRGKSPKYATDTGLPVISQRCVQWRGLELESAKIISRESIETYESIRFLRDEDLLWNSTGTGTIGRIVRVVAPPPKLVCDSHVTVVRILGINAEYVRSWLRSDHVYGSIEDRAAGSTNQVELTSQMAVNQVVPLPPIGEQHRIVAKVTELMALCDRLEATRGEREKRRDRLTAASNYHLNHGGDADKLRKHSHFFIENLSRLTTRPQQINYLRQTISNLAAHGQLVSQDRNEGSGADLVQVARQSKQGICEEAGSRMRRLLPAIRPEEIPTQIPPAWAWERIGNLALVRGGKRLPRGVKFSHVRTPHIYIRVTDMRNQTVLLSDLQYLDEATHHKLARYIIEKEDIFVVIVGATIGKVGVIPNELDRMHLTENAARLSFREIDQRYFLLALQSDLVQSQFIAKTYQQAQPKLALSRIESTLVPIPPLQEQRRIVTKFDELMALCDQLDTQLISAQANSNRLLEAVLYHALNPGEPIALQPGTGLFRDRPFPGQTE